MQHGHNCNYASICCGTKLAKSAMSMYIIIMMFAVHEKTRYKSKIAILDNAHLNVRTLCMLKSDWPDGDKITSV